MSNWQDAVNLMKVQDKKTKSKAKAKKARELVVGLRCWECGLYIENIRGEHYCTNCLVKHLKRFIQNSRSGSSQKETEPVEKNQNDSEDANQDEDN
jgi:hypothetical protein